LERAKSLEAAKTTRYFWQASSQWQITKCTYCEEYGSCLWPCVKSQRWATISRYVKF